MLRRHSVSCSHGVRLFKPWNELVLISGVIEVVGPQDGGDRGVASSTVLISLNIENFWLLAGTGPVKLHARRCLTPQVWIGESRVINSNRHLDLRRADDQRVMYIRFLYPRVSISDLAPHIPSFAFGLSGDQSCLQAHEISDQTLVLGDISVSSSPLSRCSTPPLELTVSKSTSLSPCS